MLNELFEGAREITDNIKFTRSFAKKAQEYEKLLREQVDRAYGTYQYLNSNDSVESEVAFAIRRAERNAPEVITEAILEAVTLEGNDEFNYPIFLHALMEVAKDPGLVKIRPRGTGWATRITATIDFEGVAGTANDWARGVTAVRASRKARSVNPDIASEIWRTRVYRQGKYDDIIQQRILESGKPAAFWVILDQGTIKLQSDIGGTAYPTNKPTHFVRKAAKEIETEFNERLERDREFWERRRETLDREIQIAQSYLVDLGKIPFLVSLELEQNEALYDSFSDHWQYIDQDKLDNVLARIRNDLYVYATVEGRVEVTASYSPLRYRPSLRKLQRIVERGY